MGEGGASPPLKSPGGRTNVAQTPGTPGRARPRTQVVRCEGLKQTRDAATPAELRRAGLRGHGRLPRMNGRDAFPQSEAGGGRPCGVIGGPAAIPGRARRTGWYGSARPCEACCPGEACRALGGAPRSLRPTPGAAGRPGLRGGLLARSVRGRGEPRAAVPGPRVEANLRQQAARWRTGRRVFHVKRPAPRVGAPAVAVDRRRCGGAGAGG